MPPNAKPPRGLAQKRRAQAANTANKRAKVSTSGVGSLGTGGSPQKPGPAEGFLNFDGKPPHANLRTKFIHPMALQFFKQAQTFVEFCASSFFFWVAHSVWVRGCPSEYRIEMYKDITTHVQNENFHKEEWQTAFEQQYRRVTDGYIGKIKHVADSWMKSPAGQEFVARASKSRDSRLPKPRIGMDLTSWNGLEGLQWGLPEVLDFYEILIEFALITEVEHEGLDKKRLEGEWFNADVTPMGEANKPWDWYEHLGIAAITVIQQWILLTNGISSPGKRLPLADDASIERLCYGIPTGKFKAEDDSQEYPPFPFDSTLQLSELTSWFSDDYGPHKLPSANQLSVIRGRQHLHDIENEPSFLPDTELRDVLDRSHDDTHKTHSAVEAAIEHMASATPFQALPPEADRVLRPQNPPDLLKLPPALMYPPQLTPTEYAWLVGNTATKVEITMAIAQQELDAWDIFATRCKDEFYQWDKKLKGLETIRGLVKRSKETAILRNEARAEKAKEVDQADAEVNSALKNPKVHRQVAAELREVQKPSLQSPAAARGSPRAFTPMSTPREDFLPANSPLAMLTTSEFGEPKAEIAFSPPYEPQTTRVKDETQEDCRRSSLGSSLGTGKLLPSPFLEGKGSHEHNVVDLEDTDMQDFTQESGL